MNSKTHFILTMSLILASFYSPAQELPIPSLTSRFDCSVTSVKNQGRTGTCWSFSTTSMLESEYIKSTNQEIDLSEMFNVRYIYKQKAEKYLRMHGTSPFSQGSLGHDVLHVLKNYGAVPEQVYPGLNGNNSHDHTQLEHELKNYLDTSLNKRPFKANTYSGIDSILDKHLGSLPELFEYNGTLYNPKSFARKVLAINPDQYIGLTSFLHHPPFESFILEVPDNFSHGMYVNLPLDDLIRVIDRSLELGHTVEWDGDVSEKGFSSRFGFAVFNNDPDCWNTMPVLPVEEEGNAQLRQNLFDNLETTDDHLMQISGVAYSDDGRKFYKTKNSWGKSSGLDGFLYMSENYIRMKTVSIIVHKSAIPADLIDQL